MRKKYQDGGDSEYALFYVEHILPYKPLGTEAQKKRKQREEVSEPNIRDIKQN